jgi:hypothetical protein
MILLAFILGGCAETLKPPPGEQFVELARTTRVQLKIVNESGEALELVAPAGQGVPLAPGGEVLVPVLVTKVAKLSDMAAGAPTGALVPSAGAEFYTMSSDAPNVVQMQGPRGVVQLRETGHAWTFFLKAGECVFCGEHVATLRVRHRPSLVEPPVDLCGP